MNPFEDQPTDDISVIDTKKFKIEIWIESKGRKSITFISGWNIEDNLMTDHLKIIKKKIACNGSFKTEGDLKIMQFQGDHIKYVHGYLKQQDIDDESIIIRGNSVV
jgi:translation initiation factor 1 (eIF-1/SUI1)